MAILITQIDAQTLNSTEGIQVNILRNSSGNDFTVSNTKRTRTNQTPKISNEVFDSRRRTFHVSPNPSIINTADPVAVEDFDSLVHKIFMPWQGDRTLLGTDHNGTNYDSVARVTRFGRRSPTEFEGEFEFTSAVWETVAGESETTSPLTVTGNVFAQPTITIDGATSITRTRLTITDRTGHGIMGHMIAVAALGGAAADHLVYMNGIEIPFTLSSGNLFFRVSAPPPNGFGATSTFVDIFYGTAINNTVTADQLDAAGITLDSGVLTGVVTTDASDPFSNALASSLSWHPGIVTRHPRNRGYTFGFDGADTIRLVDRSATGTQYNLPDDADAYILTSPVEIASIADLSFDVTAEYVPGQNSSSGSGDERVMKVTIATIDGSSMVDAPKITGGFPNVRSTLTPGTPDSYPGARNDYLFYTQFTFGDVTFPHTFSYDSRNDPQSNISLSIAANASYDGASIQGTVWRNDYVPWEIQTLAEQYLGCTVSTGSDGEWYLHFPAGSFRDQEDLPLLSMSLQGKRGDWNIPNNDAGQADIIMVAEGNTSLNDVLLFNSEWVDPDTLEPLDRADPDAPANEDPLAGTVTAFVAKRTRDSEDWVTVWEQVVTGASPSGTTSSLTPTGLTGLNAVQIAVGLKPSSTNPNTVDSGTLTITTSPEITLNSSKTPTKSTSSGLSAQLINGILTNTTTGKYIQFTDIVGAADGLIIDTTNLTIQASSGPFYGRINSNGGARLFDLLIGDNDWTSTIGGSPTITFDWYNREAN